MRTTWAASKRASSKLLFQTIDWNGDDGDGDDGDGDGGEEEEEEDIVNDCDGDVEDESVNKRIIECAVILKSIIWQPGKHCWDAAVGS